MITAAGIMFRSRKTGNVLFLKRGLAGDHPGEWCFPGGKQEDGESLIECAHREVTEEIGFLPKGTLAREWTRSISSMQAAVDQAPVPEGAIIQPIAPEVDFSTYLVLVDEEFAIENLQDEHVAWAWAPPASPPEPLHPGCRVSLDRLTMDEMGIARAISVGALTSPQRYENIDLFAVRVTGTGMSYRNKFDEFVWRDPSLYLNDEFLARCAGLPVIADHPKKGFLNSKEFSDRIVGTILFAYIKGDEVWGIAKIYDDDTAKLMRSKQLSTSPCVVFRDPSVNNKVELEEGSKLLIEGKPSLLDHLAICERGVWDKGKEPTGVQTQGDLVMADEEKKHEEKSDDNGQKIDMLLKGISDACAKMDSINERMDRADARMDSFEKERSDSSKKDEDKKEEEKKEAKDDAEKEKTEEKVDSKKDSDKKDASAEEETKKEEPKPVAADKRKDSEEKEKEDHKSDSDVSALRAEIAELKKRMPVARSDNDRAQLYAAQAKADNIYHMFGDAAPRAMDGETVQDYRRRLVNGLKGHSKRWKEVNLAIVAADAQAFDIIEEQVFGDAAGAAMKPVDLPEGTLRAVVRNDDTGRKITDFYGEPKAWMGQFGAPKRRLIGIRNSSNVH